VNGYDETDGYIWPEKFNKAVIDGIRRRINNSQRFSSQYLNTIMAPEDATFSIDKVKWFDQHTVKPQPDSTYEIRRPDGTFQRVQPQLFIDPAATVSSTSDFTVLGVGGYDEDKNLIVLDLVIGRFQPSQVTDELFKLCDKWRLSRVTVEMVGGFKLYAHVINTEMRRRNRLLSIMDYRPPHNLNKKARIEAWLEPLLTNGMLFISTHLALNAELRNEFTMFPRGHDDVLDVLAALAEIGKPTRRKGATGASTPRRQVNTRYGGNRA
jgi:predicted phage terminase large subunit-like protein